MNPLQPQRLSLLPSRPQRQSSPTESPSAIEQSSPVTTTVHLQPPFLSYSNQPAGASKAELDILSHRHGHVILVPSAMSTISMLLLKTARTFLAMAPHRCGTLLLPTVACQSRLHILLSQRAAGFAIMSMLFVVTVLVAAPMLGKYDRVPSVCGNACLANTRCFQCPQSSHAISTFFSARQCLSVLVNTEVRSCATCSLHSVSSSPWAFVHSISQRRPVQCLLSTLHKLPQHNHSTPLVFHAVGAPQNVNETPLCPPSLCPSAFSSCAVSSLHVAASFRPVCSAQLSIPPPYHTTLRCSILRAPFLRTAPLRPDSVSYA